MQIFLSQIMLYLTHFFFYFRTIILSVGSLGDRYRLLARLILTLASTLHKPQRTMDMNLTNLMLELLLLGLTEVQIDTMLNQRGPEANQNLAKKILNQF